MNSKVLRLLFVCLFAAFVALVAGDVRADFSEDLVAYWPLNDNFEDAWGEFDGEENGSDPIEFDTGQFDDGIVLDGTNQYVEIIGGETDSLDFVETEMSVSAWFRVDAFDTSWQALIAKGENDGWRIHRRGDEAGMAFNAGGPDTPTSDFDVDDGEIHHLVAVSAADGPEPNGATTLYIDGEFAAENFGNPIGVPNTNNRVRIGDNPSTNNREWEGLIDDVAIWARALTEEEVEEIWNDGEGKSIGELVGVDGDPLQAGDANMDCSFDQLDIIQVSQRAKYLTGDPATWGDGDWNGAPGGSASQQQPPPGNGLFDQLDIIASLTGNQYLQGNYCAGAGFAAIGSGGEIDDGQTSIVYNANTGEVAVEAPAGGPELTSVNIDSAAGIFVNHEAAENLDGSFDTASDENIFKATFGNSFGDTSFGLIAETGLAEDFVAGDLMVIGSLDGGGGLGDVDLVYIPEPSTVVLLGVGLVMMLIRRRR